MLKEKAKSGTQDGGGIFKVNSLLFYHLHKVFNLPLFCSYDYTFIAIEKKQLLIYYGI